jgi:hypothetical protein
MMVDSDLVESAMNEIISDIRQHQDDALSKILGTTKEAVSPNTKQFEYLPGSEEVWSSIGWHN